MTFAKFVLLTGIIYVLDNPAYAIDHFRELYIATLTPTAFWLSVPLELCKHLEGGPIASKKIWVGDVIIIVCKNPYIVEGGGAWGLLYLWDIEKFRDVLGGLSEEHGVERGIYGVWS